VEAVPSNPPSVSAVDDSEFDAEIDAALLPAASEDREVVNV